MKRWIRLYTEVPDDLKVQSLPPLLFRFWINCLCIAGRFDGILPKNHDLAFALRMDYKKVLLMSDELVKAGLLEVDSDDVTLRPHGWNDRQYESDVSTDRVKRFRERSKNVTTNATGNVRASESVSVSVSVSEVNQKERARDVPTIPEFGPEFERVIGAFLASGVKLCEQDTLEAAQEWSQLTVADWHPAADAAEKRARANEARFMGLPANFLRKREWTRRGPGRLIPEPRVASKGEIAQETAGRNFLRKRGIEA